MQSSWSESEIKNYKEKIRERRSGSARYGHIKRRLSRNRPLSDETLVLALDIIDRYDENDLARGIGIKLKARQPLTDYELHIFLDVLMLHHRLKNN
jgi:hypothetical protein